MTFIIGLHSFPILYNNLTSLIHDYICDSRVSVSTACPSVFENVTWNDAVYGDVDVRPCPRGAKGLYRIM